MSTTLSNPAAAVQLKCQLVSGAVPAIVTSQVNHQPNISLGTGNTAGNVDRCFSESFTVSAGSPWTVNLTTADDPLNSAIGMVHASAVLVENDSTTTGQDFTVGGGSNSVLQSNQGTAQANGGVFLLLNPNPGYVVGTGSNTLQISVASGTNVPGKITILGRSA